MSKNAVEEKKPGQRLEALRRKKGITQKFIAKQLGIDQTLLCRMEQDERPWTPEQIKDYEALVA